LSLTVLPFSFSIIRTHRIRPPYSNWDDVEFVPTTVSILMRRFAASHSKLFVAVAQPAGGLLVGVVHQRVIRINLSRAALGFDLSAAIWKRFTMTSRTH
jgi:hypothetical protein